jgi:trans-2,3-dihydro-3-hydroxyanthranilate isomerase
MTRRRYVTADVFTDQLFGGNPVAVVLDAQGLTSAQMQAIALEFNYSETTFVLPPQNPAHTAQVRIFTPRTEVPFAGHPNVGTAFLLAREPQFAQQVGQGRFVFEEAAGLVPLDLLHEDGAVVGAELCAPELLSRRTAVVPTIAAACLSLGREVIVTSTHAPQIASVGLPFLVVELATRDALRHAKPNLAAYGQLLPLDGADAVFAYTRESAAALRQETVLHARMFSPLDGIVEDPATGSAAAATIALLASSGGLPDGMQRWRVHQGVDMGRPSLLLGRTRTSGGRTTETYIGGRCVAFMTGTFEL